MEFILTEKDKKKITIEDLLKSHTQGLTIKEIMDKTGLARHTVLARLHRLIGEGKVNLRQINMAKLHYWKEDQEEPKKEDFGKTHKEIKEKVSMQPLKEKHFTKPKTPIKKPKIDIAKIKEEVEAELHRTKRPTQEKQIIKQRVPITKTIGDQTTKIKTSNKEFIKTGVPGFDDLFNQGIPKGNSILVAGGAGSGKTILTLQTLYNHAKEGKNCLYMSFEESEEKLIRHMEDFGWDPKPLIKKGNLIIKRFNPFDITRSVDALLMKAKGELLIDVEPIILPENFQPDLIVVDSLTAIASAFTGKEDSYRIYIEQLFRFFEKLDATSFLITETKQIPTIFSQTGVEEFLADGVIVLYSLKRGNIRENAIEVLKLRGAKHQKRIVAMQITNEGIIVYPEQEVFGNLGE